MLSSRHWEEFNGLPDQTDSVPWREAFPEYRDEDLPGVSLLGARTKEGITQTRLAELTGIPQRNLSTMEHGKRIVGRKMRVCWARS